MDFDIGEDVLLQRPWIPVGIGGCRLLAKSCFGKTAYRVLLTDMCCVWEERMEAAGIQRRAQELNRRLRASVDAFFSHLCEVAQPFLSGDHGEAQISLTRRGDDNSGVSVRMKSELGGLPFYWEFQLNPAPVAMACTQLVRPLLAMSRLLQQQVEQLGSLLLRKDEEIQDYQENGASLSRERLKTDVFVEKTYKEDFMAKVLPELWSEHSDAQGFDGHLQQLYAAVVAHRQARKRKPVQERCVEEDQLVFREAAHTSPQDVGSESSEPTDEDRQESRAKMADRPTIQQSVPAGSVPAGSVSAASVSAAPVSTAPVSAAPASATPASAAPASATPAPAQRPSSKAKKKKVGLFR